MKRLSIAVAALAAIFASSIAIGGPDVDVLVKGQHSNIKYYTTKDIHNQADFDAFMATAFDKGKAPSVPAVDWSKQLVLAVFAGYQQHSGYTLRFTKVDDSGDTIQVSVRVVVPCEERAGSDASQPFLIVAIPASTKAVNFNEPEQQNQKC